MLAVHHDRKTHLRVFAAGKHPHLTCDMFVRQTAFGKAQADFTIFHRRKLCPECVKGGFLRIAVCLLLKIAREKVVPKLNFAGKRRKLTENRFQKRRFAESVGSDDGNLLPAFKCKRYRSCKRFILDVADD